MRLFPAARKLIADDFKRGLNIKVLADVFGISRQTASKWAKGKGRIGKTRFLDKKREAKQSKITLKVELAILAMRTLFEWGTARIQQGLMDLPDFRKQALQNTVENVKLSRTAINNVLIKHKLNGYKKSGKEWKFFRAKRANELWQIDIKGPFTLQGKKYYFLVCIDDYSRYMLLAEQFDHALTTNNIIKAVEKIGILPDNILADNGPQFRKEWEDWCRRN